MILKAKEIVNLIMGLEKVCQKQELLILTGTKSRDGHFLNLFTSGDALTISFEDRHRMALQKVLCVLLILILIWVKPFEYLRSSTRILSHQKHLMLYLLLKQESSFLSVSIRVFSVFPYPLQSSSVLLLIGVVTVIVLYDQNSVNCLLFSLSEYYI